MGMRVPIEKAVESCLSWSSLIAAQPGHAKANADFNAMLVSDAAREELGKIFRAYDPGLHFGDDTIERAEPSGLQRISREFLFESKYTSSMACDEDAAICLTDLFPEAEPAKNPVFRQWPDANKKFLDKLESLSQQLKTGPRTLEAMRAAPSSEAAAHYILMTPLTPEMLKNETKLAMCDQVYEYAKQKGWACASLKNGAPTIGSYIQKERQLGHFFTLDEYKKVHAAVSELFNAIAAQMPDEPGLSEMRKEAFSKRSIQFINDNYNKIPDGKKSKQFSEDFDIIQSYIERCEWEKTPGGRIANGDAQKVRARNVRIG